MVTSSPSLKHLLPEGYLSIIRDTRAVSLLFEYCGLVRECPTTNTALIHVVRVTAHSV